MLATRYMVDGNSRWKAVYAVRSTLYELEIHINELASYVDGSSGRVFCSLSQSGGFSFDSFFFFHCSLLFLAILKTSADTNAGQSRRLTHCIKNLHRLKN